MALFYGWDSFALRLQHLRGGSLLLTIQFPVISGAHFINLKRIKGAESTLEPPNGFEHGPLDWEPSALNTTPLLHQLANFWYITYFASNLMSIWSQSH